MILFLFLGKFVIQRFQRRQTGICLGLAVTRTLVEIFSAGGAKTLAIRSAEHLCGELHIQQVEQLPIHVQKAVFNDKTVIQLVFIHADSIGGGRQRLFERKGETVAHIGETTGTGGDEFCRQSQIHVDISGIVVDGTRHPEWRRKTDTP